MPYKDREKRIAQQRRYYWSTLERRQRHNSSVRNRLLFKKYKLTPETLQSLLSSQNGVCTACKEPFKYAPFQGRPAGAAHMELACIDHDHSCCPEAISCGKCVRGVIHNRCNSSLGLSGDNPTRLKNIAAYAENQRKKARGVFKALSASASGRK